MRLAPLAAAGLCLGLGACAAAVPGYQPPTPKLEKYKASVERGGGFDQTGRYSLSEQEQAADCRQLTGSMTIKIIQMRDTANRARPSAAAALAQQAVRPVVGGTRYGASVEEDLKRDRARLEALNARLAGKGCPTFDLADALRPGNTEPPRPLKAAAKGKQP
jgi:hypothetical protein